MVYLGLGGADQMSAAIQNVAAGTGKEYDSLFAGTTVIGIISTAAWGLGYFGQPHILARFMAAESAKSLVSARRIGMTWMVLCLAGAVAVGYFGIAYFGANQKLARQSGHDRRQKSRSKIMPAIQGLNSKVESAMKDTFVVALH